MLRIRGRGGSLICHQCWIKQTLVRIHDFAFQAGGQCLSKRYRGRNAYYRFVCAASHKFEATAASVLDGHWCAKCSTERRAERRRYQGGLKPIQDRARERGGECLSTVYDGRKKDRPDIRPTHVAGSRLCRSRTCARGLQRAVDTDSSRPWQVGRACPVRHRVRSAKSCANRRTVDPVICNGSRQAGKAAVVQRQRNRERSILGGLATFIRRVSLSSSVIVSGANNSASEMPSGPHNAANASTVGFVTPDSIELIAARRCPVTGKVGDLAAQ